MGRPKTHNPAGKGVLYFHTTQNWSVQLTSPAKVVAGRTMCVCVRGGRRIFQCPSPTIKGGGLQKGGTLAGNAQESQEEASILGGLPSWTDRTCDQLPPSGLHVTGEPQGRFGTCQKSTMLVECLWVETWPGASEPVSNTGPDPDSPG